MNKKIFILLIVCVGIVVAVALYATARPRVQPLVVLSTSPVNQASLNPYLPIIITFSRALSENETTVSIVPTTKTRTVIEGNTIKISPITTFLPETQYTVLINTSPPYSFSFTTETALENSPGWNEANKLSGEQYQQQHGVQDAAIIDMLDNVPLQQNGFAINYSYANSTFTITLSPPYEQNKEKFLSWFAQKGVTDLTIVRLNYVNQ